MPIDYSKWNKIEVSDDEDDTHPNVDTPSLFRWRHQARMEKMAEMQQAKQEVEGGKKNVLTKMQEIEQKLKDPNLDEKERIKLELERDQMRKQEEEYMRKERELEEQERRQPWNVDTIGKEKWSKTVINKPKPEQNKTSSSGPSPKDGEEQEFEQMQKYFEDNESLLKRMCQREGLDQMEVMLMEHPHLASEYATNYMTVEALNHAIDEDEPKLSRTAANCITVQYLLELAKSLNALATNTNMIKNFFKKFRSADQAYWKAYEDEVEAFKERLRKRARDKREAMVNELEAEEKAKRIAESPGELDPQEVFESLPKEMREAFETRSMDKMYEVADRMDAEVFQHHLQRCIDAGLWVENAEEHQKKAEADGNNEEK